MADNPDSFALAIRQVSPHHLHPDALITPADYLPLKPNNFHIDFASILKVDPVVIEILRGHPLRQALTIDRPVPIVYLQQYWKSLQCVQVGTVSKLRGQVDAFEIDITIPVLRRILHLPQPADQDDKDTYDDLLSDQDLFREVIALGYNGTFTQIKNFRRANLQGLWFDIFSILNRCLTSKATGTDSASTSVLHMFHAVAYDRHIDYASIIWNELVEVINDKSKAKARKFIPFMRFLQMIIRHCMVREHGIRSRDRLPKCPSNAMQYLVQRTSDPSVHAIPIPLALLRHARQDHQDIQDYMAAHYPDNPAPEPAEASSSDSDSQRQSEASASQSTAASSSSGPATDNESTDDASSTSTSSQIKGTSSEHTDSDINIELRSKLRSDPHLSPRSPSPQTQTLPSTPPVNTPPQPETTQPQISPPISSHPTSDIVTRSYLASQLAPIIQAQSAQAEAHQAFVTRFNTQNSLMWQTQDEIRRTQASIINSQAAIQSSLTSIQEQQALLMDAVLNLTETCKTAASSSKRKRDDTDDPDNPDTDSRPLKSQRIENVAADVIGSDTQDTGTERLTDAEQTGTPTIESQNNKQLIVWEDPALFLYQVTVTEVDKSDVIDLTGDDDNYDYTSMDTNVKIEEEQAMATDMLSESESLDSDEPPTTGRPDEFTCPELPTNDDVGLEKPVESQSSQAPASQTDHPPYVQESRQIYNPEWMRKFTRSKNRSPFLEDFKPSLFVHRIRTLCREKLWDLTTVPEQTRQRWYFLMKRMQKPKSEVRTDAHIRQIIQISSVFRLGVWYPMFEVLRSDSRRWLFTEADFIHLHLQDFDVLYHYFRNLNVKPSDVQLAQREVIRFMKMTVRHAMATDFQIAVESNSGRINLKKPKQGLEHLEELPVSTIIHRPEHGVVYLDGSGIKKFMRFSELHKYSDGTIYSVRRALKEKIEEIRPKTRVEQYLPPREFSDIPEAFKIMKDVDDYRKGVRRFETYFGYRSESRWTRS